jgi:hypothetical protein
MRRPIGCTRWRSPVSPKSGDEPAARKFSLSLAERWLLASTYKLAGKPDVAKALVEKDHLEAFVFADPIPTFSSLLRDRAVLMGMTLLGRDAETGALLGDVAGQLNDGSWYAHGQRPSRSWPWRRTGHEAVHRFQLRLRGG